MTSTPLLSALAAVFGSRIPCTGRDSRAFEVTDFTELYEEMRDWAPPGFRDRQEYEDKATHLSAGPPDGTSAARVLARDDRPDTWFIVDQMALYRQVGTPEIMAALIAAS